MQQLVIRASAAIEQRQTLEAAEAGRRQHTNLAMPIRSNNKPTTNDGNDESDNLNMDEINNKLENTTI